VKALAAEILGHIAPIEQRALEQHNLRQRYRTEARPAEGFDAFVERMKSEIRGRAELEAARARAAELRQAASGPPFKESMIL
jgi:hypothetical protein